MNYYEHHLGDYIRDTAHLSMIEDSAYRRLLDTYYAREKPLPADVAACCKLARAHSEEERAAVAYVLGEFFKLGEDGHRQARADAEIARYVRKMETQRANGAKGGRPRKSQSGSSSDNPTETHGFPPGSENGTQVKAHQTPDTSHQQDQQQTSSAAPLTAGSEGQGGQDDAERRRAAAATRAARLAQVTRDAIETFNASKLTKAHGGLVPNVDPQVGADKRQKQVAKCLTVARDICRKDFGSELIVRDFWAEYWELCAEDEHKSGRAGGGKDHGNWVPTFEYLTREATMLEIYDRAVSAGGAP